MTSIWEMVTWVVSFSSDWSGHGSALIWRYGSLVFHTGIWSCDSETGPCHYQKSDVDQRCDLILETKILRYCGPDLLIMNVSLFWTINWKKVRFNWNSFIRISPNNTLALQTDVDDELFVRLQLCLQSSLILNTQNSLLDQWDDQRWWWTV